MDDTTIVTAIQELKKRKHAVIMAHYYQSPAIQELADYIGDSLGLAQNATTTDADIILLAGVRFMAETAKILNPAKKVLIPDITASCSLADNCSAIKYKEYINRYPDAVKISYVNCSVEIKALSDILCTSSNAFKIVDSVPKDKTIIFGPDRNLGSYIARKTGREILLWDACCIVHDAFTAKDINEVKKLHPDALVLAHPECREEVLNLADFIGSTSGMLEYSKKEAGPFVIVTETGIIHQMQKASPNKLFLTPNNSLTPPKATCLEMRKCTLEGILNCLEEETFEVEVSEDIRKSALKPLERMLELSK